MYKKIKQQIANQTRKDVGFVKMNDVRGYRFIKVPPTQKTTIPKDKEVIDKQEFFWSKTHYIKDRTSRYKSRENQVERFYHSVPVVNTDTYGEKYPSKELGRDYYNIREGVTSASIDDISGGVNGSFIDQKIFQDINTAYTISLSGGDGYVVLGLEANDVSFSVWKKDAGDEIATLISDSGSAGLDGLTNVSIPVSSDGTMISILVYAHSLDFPHSNDSLRINIDKYFKVSTDFSNLLSQPPEDLNPDVGYISWDDPAVTSSVDKETWKVTNTLHFVRDKDKYWKGVEIYKSKHYQESIDCNLSNSNYYDNIVIDTSDASNYQIGSVVNIGNQSDKINGVRINYKNYILDGGFDWDGERPSSSTAWFKTCTSAGTSNYGHTSYPYLAERIFGDRSFRLDTFYTDTTKTCGIYSNGFAIGDANYYIITDTSSTKVSLYVKHLSGKPTGAVKLKFYDSGGDYVDSAAISLHSDYTDWNGYNGWGRFLASASAFNYPHDTYRCDMFIFGSYEHNSASSYLIDGVHIGTADSKYIFSRSYNVSSYKKLEPTDRVVVQLEGDYEKPITERTNFALRFDDGYEDYITNMDADTVYGSPMYLDSANSNWAKFGSGRLFDDSATNLVANSNFMSGVTGWSTSLGATMEVVNEESLFSNTGYARFEGFGEGSFANQNFDIVSDGSNNRYTCAVWAKSIYARQQLKTRYRYTDTNDDIVSASATFDLSSEWKKFTFSSSFSANSATSELALMSLFDDNMFSIDIAAVQVEENRDNISGWGTRDSAGVVYHTSDALCGEYGTVRFWYTPTMNHMANRGVGDNYRGLFYFEDDSGNYKSIYYDPDVNRYIFRQKDGGSIYVSSVAPSQRTRYDGIYYPNHIVASWDTTNAYLYVNKNRGNASDSRDIDCKTFAIGCYSPNRSSSYSALGVISNVRIDGYTWSYTDIVTDCDADYFSPQEGDTLEVENSEYLGQKIADKDRFSFVDETDIQRGYKYSYNFRCFDEFGNYSPFSEEFYGEAYTWTPRPGYEYTMENKVANSGFEVVNYFTGFPLYWEGNGSVESGETYSYTGEKCLHFPSYDDYVVSEYVWLNTSVAMHFSFWTKDDRNRFDVIVDYYNTRWEKIQTVEYDTFNDYEVDSENEDGSTWYRPYVRLTDDMDTHTSCKYAKFKFTSKWSGAYLDCIQVEQDTVRPWRESTIIGPDEVDGNMVSFDSLQGRHLYSGELIVSGHSSDANRIIVGRENDYGARFVEITPFDISFNRNTDVDTNLAYINSTALYIGYRTDAERFFKATPSGIEIGRSGTDTALAYFTSTALYIGKSINKDTAFLSLKPQSITMGEENSGDEFFKVTPDKMYYHPKGEDIETGWFFTKMVQSGVGTFGETEDFPVRYTKDGSPFSPKCVVYPKSMVTYSPQAKSAKQRVDMAIVATAKSIRVDATLSAIPGESSLTTEDISSLNYSGSGNSDSLEISDGASSVQEDEATFILSNPSESKSGVFSCRISGQKNGTMDVEKLFIYCTSNAISTDPSFTNWVELQSINLNIPSGYTSEHIIGHYNLPINNEAFSRAETIGMYLAAINTNPETTYSITCDEMSISYNDDASGSLYLEDDLEYLVDALGYYNDVVEASADATDNWGIGIQNLAGIPAEDSLDVSFSLFGYELDSGSTARVFFYGSSVPWEDISDHLIIGRYTYLGASGKFDNFDLGISPSLIEDTSISLSNSRISELQCLYIALRVGNSSDYVEAEMRNIVAKYYAGSSSEITLLSGSDMGQYGYIAFDGGQS